MSVASALMAGRKGLVMGVANDRSIAWGVARALAAAGASLAVSYQDQAVERRVRPLAESVGARLVLPCDVEDAGALDRLFAALAREWTNLDFVVHAIAYSDKRELGGSYVATSAENFRRTLDVSCYSFTALARRASALMAGGGSLLTLTYGGSRRVIPGYNVMGVAKAALEASVRYLAADLGRQGIRVNAISAGPMRTLAGSAIAGARRIYRWSGAHAPLRRNVALEEIGSAALYLLGDLSRGVTGEILFVDAGYHAIGMARPGEAESATSAEEAF